MLAVVIHHTGGPEVLTLEERPVPVPRAGEVQITVKAAGLNHLDLWVRTGLPGAGLPITPGSDGAGIVTAVGDQVEGWALGDEVLVQPGTFCGTCPACRQGRENFCPSYGILGETGAGLLQEVVSLRPENIYRKPPTLDWPEAASFGLVFLTAYQMLVERARLQPGETVLVLAGSSGVGAAAIQIAAGLGARVIATASPGPKTEFARSMGAAEVVDHYSDGWHKEVVALAGPDKVQVVVEHTGAATWSRSLRVLGLGGRIVVCGATTGAKVDLELRHLFRKQQTVLGSTMGSLRSFAAVVDGFAAGRYRPIVDKVFPLTEIAAAHEYLEQSRHAGKVVISLGAATAVN